MKKSIILSVAVLSAGFISCKKQETKVEEKKVESIITKGIAEAIKQEHKIVLDKDLDIIPVEYKVNCKENSGTIQHITYKTKNYFGDKSEMEKKANVYLPAGYDESKKYSVLYLMHGIGGNENEWGMTDDNSLVKKMMDNLIAKGDIEPFIVITPNGRSGRDFAKTDSDFNAFYKFGEELRNDLIPYMDTHYSTIADRNHRGMAGLSMGGMQTINIGICECLDLISWFGAFSAAPTSYDAAKVADYITTHPEWTVNYFYNICGTEDGIAYGSHKNAAYNLPQLSPKIIDGENYKWQQRTGGHDFGIWHLGFFNFAKIFGNNKIKTAEQLEKDCPENVAKLQPGVKYGKIVNEKYNSTTIGIERKCNVLLPANYDETKKYPVLYLLHGIFGDENSFTGDPNNKIKEIFGNLISDKQAKEMIVVFPNMYATADPNMKPAFDPSTMGPYNDFINDFLTDLMPFIESKYNVLTGKENTALAGFSLGARQSLWIGILHPELFGYVGAIAPAPGLVHTRDWAMEHPGLLKENEVTFKADNRPSVLMICAGDSDKVVGQYPKSYHELFEKNNVEHMWYEIEGADHDSRAIKSGIYHFISLIFR